MNPDGDRLKEEQRRRDQHRMYVNRHPNGTPPRDYQRYDTVEEATAARTLRNREAKRRQREKMRGQDGKSNARPTGAPPRAKSQGAGGYSHHHRTTVPGSASFSQGSRTGTPRSTTQATSQGSGGITQHSRSGNPGRTVAPRSTKKIGTPGPTTRCTGTPGSAPALATGNTPVQRSIFTAQTLEMSASKIDEAFAAFPKVPPNLRFVESNKEEIAREPTGVYTKEEEFTIRSNIPDALTPGDTDGDDSNYGKIATNDKNGAQLMAGEDVTPTDQPIVLYDDIGDDVDMQKYYDKISSTELNLLNDIESQEMAIHKHKENMIKVREEQRKREEKEANFELEQLKELAIKRREVAMQVMKEELKVLDAVETSILSRRTREVERNENERRELLEEQREYGKLLISRNESWVEMHNGQSRVQTELVNRSRARIEFRTVQAKQSEWKDRYDDLDKAQKEEAERLGEVLGSNSNNSPQANENEKESELQPENEIQPDDNTGKLASIYEEKENEYEEVQDDVERDFQRVQGGLNDLQKQIDLAYDTDNQGIVDESSSANLQSARKSLPGSEGIVDDSFSSKSARKSSPDREGIDGESSRANTQSAENFLPDSEGSVDESPSVKMPAAKKSSPIPRALRNKAKVIKAALFGKNDAQYDTGHQYDTGEYAQTTGEPTSDDPESDAAFVARFNTSTEHRTGRGKPRRSNISVTLSGTALKTLLEEASVRGVLGELDSKILHDVCTKVRKAFPNVKQITFPRDEAKLRAKVEKWIKEDFPAFGGLT